MTDVAVDACCLINLLAARSVLHLPVREGKRSKDPRRPDKLHSLGLILHVPNIVSSESLYILQPDHEDPTWWLKSPVDLEPYFTAGVLHRCEVDPDEAVLFVRYASKLDDGEAACLAIAKNRGWLLATDDRPATSLASKDGVTVLTTAELLMKWAANTKVPKSEIALALLNIQRFARFVPRKNSREAAWWLSHFSNK